tara:strand:- start:470 stop:640 length:171 start_codon:yes stop_codon:yes gene_type:complete
LDAFHAQTAPLRSYYQKSGLLSVINAALPSSHVFAQIKAIETFHKVLAEEAKKSSA